MLMATNPTPITVPESLTDLDGLRTWLLANCQSSALAYSILALIAYTFPIVVKIVLVRPTTLPYAADPVNIPGKQGRVDILISDGLDPDCLYQHIVLDSAFNFANTKELVVEISSLNPH
ncbi:hypothetical protein [Burkholderia phage FLC9]|nr:hypothetical protein [Burkholderia phage FLC9]